MSTTTAVAMEQQFENEKKELKSKIDEMSKQYGEYLKLNSLVTKPMMDHIMTGSIDRLSIKSEELTVLLPTALAEREAASKELLAAGVAQHVVQVRKVCAALDQMQRSVDQVLNYLRELNQALSDADQEASSRAFRNLLSSRKKHFALAAGFGPLPVSGPPPQIEPQIKEAIDQFSGSSDSHQSSISSKPKN